MTAACQDACQFAVEIRPIVEVPIGLFRNHVGHGWPRIPLGPQAESSTFRVDVVALTFHKAHAAAERCTLAQAANGTRPDAAACPTRCVKLAIDLPEQLATIMLDDLAARRISTAAIFVTDALPTFGVQATSSGPETTPFDGGTAVAMARVNKAGFRIGSVLHNSGRGPRLGRAAGVATFMVRHHNRRSRVDAQIKMHGITNSYNI